MSTESHDKMIEAFQQYLNGRNALNIKAPTKQVLRHGIGYQKYATKHQKGE